MRRGTNGSIGGWLRCTIAAGLTLVVLIPVSFLAAAESGDDSQQTSINEIIMYGVDNDTNELVRYSFGLNQYMVIGEIADENGEVVEEIESLGYIPNGPGRGLYGVTNYDGSRRSRLVRFSAFDATVTVYPVDIGFGNIEGMVVDRHPETGQWRLYATQSGSVQGNGNGLGNGLGGGNGNGDGNGNGGDVGQGNEKVLICHIPPGNSGNAHTILVGQPAVNAHLAHGDVLGSCGGSVTISSRNLIEIDPETGVGEMLMQLDRRYEGLALGPDGVFLAASDDELWEIDLHNGTVTEVGDHGFDDVEALETIVGDYEPGIDVPGVPTEWTAAGILFGFGDRDNAVIILDPATGNAFEYECAVDASDLEGMVLLTVLTDPFGVIVAGPFD